MSPLLLDFAVYAGCGAIALIGAIILFDSTLEWFFRGRVQ